MIPTVVSMNIYTLMTRYFPSFPYFGFVMMEASQCDPGSHVNYDIFLTLPLVVT